MGKRNIEIINSEKVIKNSTFWKWSKNMLHNSPMTLSLIIFIVGLLALIGIAFFPKSDADIILNKLKTDYKEVQTITKVDTLEKWQEKQDTVQ